jgi:signal transduction histidine kinase
MLNDKYIIPVFIAGTILFVLFAFFLIAYLVVQKQKQNAYALEKQKMIYDNEIKLMNARIEEQEKAMSQISKEIHDDVGQTLSLIKLNTHILATNEGIAANEEHAIVAANTNELLIKTISTIRNISHSLNSDYIKLRGIGDVLKKELEYVGATRNVLTSLHVEGVYRTLFMKKTKIKAKVSKTVKSVQTQ